MVYFCRSASTWVSFLRGLSISLAPTYAVALSAAASGGCRTPRRSSPGTSPGSSAGHARQSRSTCACTLRRGCLTRCSLASRSCAPRRPRPGPAGGCARATPGGLAPSLLRSLDGLLSDDAGFVRFPATLQGVSERDLDRSLVVARGYGNHRGIVVLALRVSWPHVDQNDVAGHVRSFHLVKGSSI